MKRSNVVLSSTTRIEGKCDDSKRDDRPEDDPPLCGKCQTPLKLWRRRYGTVFYGCPHYSDCIWSRITVQLTLKNGALYICEGDKIDCGYNGTCYLARKVGWDKRQLVFTLDEEAHQVPLATWRVYGRKRGTF